MSVKKIVEFLTTFLQNMEQKISITQLSPEKKEKTHKSKSRYKQTRMTRKKPLSSFIEKIKRAPHFHLRPLQKFVIVSNVLL